MAGNDNKAGPDAKKLAEYRRKRSASTTPEPFDGGGVGRRGMFVVQKHHATRLHYDFRLEVDGVLKSWACPKGPSPDPAEKRLAMEVEDHPIEYGDFEGVIPDGNYGAGPSIVWDRGRWIPHGDFHESYREGKILFELRGHKLRGMWSLVRMKGSKEWLLIKETGDAHVVRGGSFPEASIFSGLDVEELRAASTRAQELLGKLEQAKVPKKRLRAADVELMLAEAREEPFDNPEFLFELKLDGYRAICARENGAGLILYRSGANATARFPDLASALARLPFDHIVLDGEIAILDERGHPDFQLLQRRGMLTQRLEIERTMIELPATYFAFDLLGLGDYDLRSLPLTMRKQLLKTIVPPLGPIRYVEEIPGAGKALFESVRELGLEGVVAKRATSRYRGGRHPDWLKVRIENTGDFVVIGYTKAKRSRTGFGSLVLAMQGPEGLQHLGRVGTGFNQEELEHTIGELSLEEIKKPVCKVPPSSGKEFVWVQPRLIVEVRYLGVTDEGILRQPAFLRFRTDKSVPDGPLPQPAHLAAPSVAKPDPEPAVERKVPITNPKKIFWPESGFTKGDLIAYYRAISPWLLPYLKDRPLTLTRFPDGIDGKSFFQKDAPPSTPAWIRRVQIWSDERRRDLDCFVCDDLPTLTYLANLGTIPLHVWSSRVQYLGAPDWCIIDLDPKEAPFASVIKLAQAAHALLDELGLPNYVKTSGQKGMHVMIPLGGKLSHEQSRDLAHVLVRAIEQTHGDLGTTARLLEQRGGKVYLDYLQNGHGKTIAGAFSARPVPGATVSMPLKWNEVNNKLDPKAFTIKTAPERMERLGEDPMAEMLGKTPDLPAALAILSKKFPAR